jgi:scyllo-inositol 2-dehydrogenase (NADP+)
VHIIKVGLIGYGYAGSTFHAPILTSVPGMVLHAVASTQPEAVYADWPDALVYEEASALFSNPEIDLIVIASPNHTHFSLAQAALKAGKHTVVDKPFVIQSDEARQLIRLATQQRRLLSVYHNRRWDGDFLTVQALLKSQRLGRIVNIESRFDRFRPQVRQRWRESALAGSGLLYDIGPHLIDQALLLAGPPHAVFAEFAWQREHTQSIDFFQLVLYYEHLRIQLSAGCLVKTPTPRFILHGTQGSYVKYGLDAQEAMLKNGTTPLSPGWGMDVNAGFLNLDSEAAQEIDNQPGCYEAYYHGIAQAIYHNTPPPVLPSAGLATIELIEAALQSGQEKRLIQLG